VLEVVYFFLVENHVAGLHRSGSYCFGFVICWVHGGFGLIVFGGFLGVR